MKRLVLIMVVASVLAGCVAAPFREPARGQLPPGGPQGIVERYQKRMPENFQLLNTIVFEYNWRAFSAIGYVDIDRKNELFKLVCLNPMGVKLFELSGDRNRVENLYTIAAFSRFGDITTAVGNDIRRIYLDLAPSPEARVRKGSSSLRFQQSFGAGVLEYVFAGPEGDLIEKNYYGNNGLAWRVSYYEYREQNGKRIPFGILFLNYDFGYRLTVRQKEFHS
jgi:hypothetical protein